MSGMDALLERWGAMQNTESQGGGEDVAVAVPDTAGYTALLAYARDLEARLGRVEDLCNSWKRMATTDNTQDTTLRATVYAIRAALTATEAEG